MNARFAAELPSDPGQAFEAIVQGSNGTFYWPYREPDDLDPVHGWYTLFHLPEFAAPLSASYIPLEAGRLSDWWKPDQAHVYLFYPIP